MNVLDKLRAIIQANEVAATEGVSAWLTTITQPWKAKEANRRYAEVLRFLKDKVSGDLKTTEDHLLDAALKLKESIAIMKAKTVVSPMIPISPVVAFKSISNLSELRRLEKIEGEIDKTIDRLLSRRRDR